MNMRRIAVVAAVGVACALLLKAQSTPSPGILKRYASWQGQDRFQVVDTQRLPGAMTRTVKTKTGDKSVLMIDGYRVLITLDEAQPFANTKVEEFDPRRYEGDKKTIIEGLESFIASDPPGYETPTPQRKQVNGYEIISVGRKELKGGVLSVVNIFDDKNHIIVTAYLLNAPEERKFKDLEEFQRLRDRFAELFTAAMKAQT
jgi:hypothetical protein